MKQLKILQITQKPPYPKIDGGCIAIAGITEGLVSKGCKIKLITISTLKHPFKPEKFPIEILEKTKPVSVYINTKLSVWNGFKSLLKNSPYILDRFYSNDFSKQLREELEVNTYDIILLDGFYTINSFETIKKYSTAKIVYRAHNIEYQILEKNSENSTSWIKKKYWKLLSNQLKQVEYGFFSKVDAILSISSSDFEYIKNVTKSQKNYLIPFGVNLNEYIVNNFERIGDEISFFHIGAMDWQPNKLGIEWFYNKVWQNINTNSIKLVLAGRLMPKEFKNWNSKHTKVIGQVNSAIDFIKENDVMVVPLFSGSGIRIKIIQAMALGKCVISTEIGIRGIEAKNKEHFLLANTSDEFIEQIESIKNNPHEAERIGKNARKLIEEKYNNSILTGKLLNFLESITQD